MDVLNMSESRSVEFKDHTPSLVMLHGFLHLWMSDCWCESKKKVAEVETVGTGKKKARCYNSWRWWNCQSVSMGRAYRRAPKQHLLQPEKLLRRSGVEGNTSPSEIQEFRALQILETSMKHMKWGNPPWAPECTDCCCVPTRQVQSKSSCASTGDWSRIMEALMV